MVFAFCRIKMEYKIIKDNRRKKLAMYVEKDGTVIIKVPKWTRKSLIERFYRENIIWIEQQREKLKLQKDNFITLSENDISALKSRAKTVLSQKTEYYSRIMGVNPESIKITSAKKRWGSCRRCAGRYSICYSWRTMLLSDRAQDYIVVHELAHIKHFNHSTAFYMEIEKILPNWKELEKETDNFKDIYLY